MVKASDINIVNDAVGTSEFRRRQLSRRRRRLFRQRRKCQTSRRVGSKLLLRKIRWSKTCFQSKNRQWLPHQLKPPKAIRQI